tara:strand:- start:642 stop:797 length:156 start_codon:yes stop_codon:yes gene_type:complete
VSTKLGEDHTIDMDETKQSHTTDTANPSSNGMRLGTGCAHATVCKNKQGDK